MFRLVLDTYRKAYGGVPRDVWLVSAILLVNRTGSMVLPFLSLYFIKDLGFENTQSGLLLTTYFGFGVFGTLLGGKLTDRIGAVPTMSLSLLFSAPIFVAVSFLQSFWSIVVGMAFLSIAFESFRPASVTATVNFCDSADQHPKAMAVNRLAVNLGLSFGPAIGGFLALYSYKWLFYGNAISCWCALVCTCFIFGWKGPVKATSPKSEDSAVEAKKKDPNRSDSPWRDRDFLIFGGINILVGIVFFQIIAVYPLYMKDHYGLQENHIGMLYAVNTIAIVLFEMILVEFVQRLNALRLVAWGHLLSCVGFGILPYAVGTTFGIGFGYCVFAMLIWTLGEMLSMPMSGAYVAQRSQDHNRGRYMALYVMTFSVSAVIAPVFGLWLYEQGPDLMWQLGMVVGVAAFAGLYYLSAPGRNKLRQTVSEVSEKREE